jgi:predicted AAA+ superfamily ATPase
LATLRRAPFAYDPRPLEEIVPGNVFTLLGPRRVGKSTTVKSHIRDLVVGGYPARRIVFYICDLLADAQELAAFLERIYDEARPDGALAGEDVPYYLFLDEVQAVRG